MKFEKKVGTLWWYCHQSLPFCLVVNANRFIACDSPSQFCYQFDVHEQLKENMAAAVWVSVEFDYSGMPSSPLPVIFDSFDTMKWNE